MNTVRLTKKFSFEMAHALHNYDGDCRNIHGHSYILEVCVIGKIKEEVSSPTDGFLIDFGEIKTIVNESVIHKFDHALVLSNHTSGEITNLLAKQYEKLEITNFNPTCENLIRSFACEISERLPVHIRLHHLKLHETKTAFCEWYASDQ